MLEHDDPLSVKLYEILAGAASQDMSFLWGLAVILVLSGCAASTGSSKSLETYLPEDADLFGTTFSYGPWFAPSSLLLFHMDEYELLIVSALEDPPDKVLVVPLQDCPKIEELRDELLVAMLESVEIGVNPDETLRPVDEIITMDGPTYTLRHFFPRAWGTVSLTGGENSRRATPWIDAALRIVDAGHDCGGD